MTASPVIDIESLLQPIPGDEPAGVDLREDYSPSSLYFAIKDAQNAARTDERKRRESFDEDSDTGFRMDHWQDVIDRAETILATKSKDLEIAVWYLEALVRGHGFVGLRDGLHLIRELVERFWDGIYPRPDEDGIATTVAPLVSLNGEDADGTLIWPLTNIAITDPSSAEPCNLWQYRQASSLQQLDSEKRQQRISEGAVSIEMFEQSVSQTPAAFFKNLLDEIAEVQGEFEKLNRVLDENCGKDSSGYPLSPPTSSIRETLAEIADTVNRTARDILESADDEAATATATTAAAAADTAAGSATAAAAAPRADGALTREQAFRQLKQLSEYFKKHEPHSPVAYLLEQAIRWGKLSLPELFAELIGDHSTRDDVFRLVGIERREQNDRD